MTKNAHKNSGSIQVGELCGYCNKETPAEDLDYVYMSTKKKHMNACVECRSKHVWYPAEDWEEDDGVIAVA